MDNVKLLILIVTMALAWATGGYAQGNPLTCADRKDITKSLRLEYREHFQGVGLVSDSQFKFIELWASNGGGFTVLGTSADGTSCLLISGKNWQVVNRGR